ncbi:uncharacterized protein C16orf95 homolog isoform 2-T2 [Thomomys bottae]
MPVTRGGKGHRDPAGGAPPLHRPERRKWKSTFQTFGKEVCLTGNSLCPSMQTILKECICCECHIKFGGHLPVPRAEAALPYWVPLSLRPRKQIPKMVRLCVPRAVRTCPCPCHSFGGRLPTPRVQAVMPYWVPRGLRSRNKIVKRQWSFKGMKASCFGFEVASSAENTREHVSHHQDHQDSPQSRRAGRPAIPWDTVHSRPLPSLARLLLAARLG